MWRRCFAIKKKNVSAIVKAPAFKNWTGNAKAESRPRSRDVAIKLRGTVERCGPCPKCGGEDRFAIKAKKQAFNCRGCDVGGDVIKLVEHLDDCDFVAACTTLTGEPPPKPNGKDAAAGRAKKIVAAEFQYEDEGGGIVLRRRAHRVAERRRWLRFPKDGKAQEEIPTEAPRS